MAKFKLSLSARADENGKSQILVRATVSRNCRVRVKTDVWVSPSMFDEKGGEDKGGCITIPRQGAQKKDAEKVKAQLNGYISKLKAVIDALGDESNITADSIDFALKAVKNIPTEDITCYSLKQESERIRNEQAEIERKKENESFFSLTETFLCENKLSLTRIKTYRVFFRGLARFESFVRNTDAKRKSFKLDIEKLTSDDLKDIWAYLEKEKELSDKFPKLFAQLLSKYPVEISFKHKSPDLVVRGQNTMNKYKKLMRRFFNWLNETKRTTNNPCKGMKIESDTYGTPYYLTLAERNKIADWDFSSNPTLEQQRDIFVFHCLVGCRVGDLIRLTPNNINGKILQYMPHKTMGKQPKVVKVALVDRAISIIKKYENDGSGKLLPFVSSTKYNKYIKQILLESGITRPVIIRNPKTGEDEKHPINELASSHMARRTFVGTLYEKIKDPAIIGSMTGHSEGSRAFSRYRDITDDIKMDAVSLIS